MKSLLLTGIILLMYMVVSCQSKNTATHNSATTAIQNEYKMSKEGFKKGVIIHSLVENDCPYVISIEETSVLIDPINLDEDFKTSQEKVWLKYRPLRMPNRCEKAVPVEITEISLRN